MWRFRRSSSCLQFRSLGVHRAEVCQSVVASAAISLAAPMAAQAAGDSASTELSRPQKSSSVSSQRQDDPGMFLIRGRPDAPIVENDRLPLPGLPQLEPESVYLPLDYGDFLKDPDVLFLFSQDAFELDLDRAAAEMENFSSHQSRSSLE